MPELRVREMTLAECELRISYFHDASDEHLQRLGVDRARMLSRDAWREFYAIDYARPLAQRQNYGVVWLLDERIVGFSTCDQIRFGEQAFMHLHITDPERRGAGLGRRFVRLSARAHLAALELQRLFCQPNAYNVAPNRALAAAGFSYDRTVEIEPSPMNFLQPVTRWVIEASDLADT